MTSTRDRALHLARRFKAHGDRILEVRLFGSMARGDQHPGSDVDRFVKVDSKDRDLVWSIRDQTCIIAEEETDYEPVLSPLIMSSDQFDELLSGPGVTEARASLPARSASSRKS